MWHLYYLGHLCKHSSVAFLVWGKKKAPFLFRVGFQLFTEIQTEWRRRCKTEDEAWRVSGMDFQKQKVMLTI